jgi:hypothetical protein
VSRLSAPRSAPRSSRDADDLPRFLPFGIYYGLGLIRFLSLLLLGLSGLCGLVDRFLRLGFLGFALLNRLWRGT